MGSYGRLAEIAAVQHGVFTLDQAEGVGFSRYSVHRRVSSGAWVALHAGVYAVNAPLTLEARVMAATMAAGPGALASHRSAAVLWDLGGVNAPDVPEVMVIGRSGRAIDGVKIHRPRVTFPCDETLAVGIPVTSPLRTLCDMATILPLRELGTAFDDARRRGLVTVEDALSRIALVEGRPIPGMRGFKRVVAARVRVPGSESALEDRFFKAVTSAGLPAPVPQYEVRRDDGTFVARVDFAYPDRKLAIELDGYAYHSSRVAFERGHMRDVELNAAGWTPVHFTDANVRRQKRWMIDQIRRFLDPRGPSSLR